MQLHNIKRFGIELEGGWDLAPRDARLFKSDSSVSVPGRWRVGEIVSPVLESWQDGSDFMLVNYPDHTGSSCGLHVHMSFGDGAANPYNVGRLADSSAYQTGLLDSLRALAAELKVTSKAFYSRLDNENSYCRTAWSPLEGLNGGTRYRAVNFAAYSKHGTVEIRVLPMFSKRQISVRMVKRVLSFTDRYLSALPAETDIVKAVPDVSATASVDYVTREVF
jgi:hypothetical protein